jgi:hypothetical protein
VRVDKRWSIIIIMVIRRTTRRLMSTRCRSRW